MGEGLEHQRAALAPVGVCVDGRVETAFDLAEDGFDLRALAVGLAFSLLLKIAPYDGGSIVAATCRLVARAWAGSAYGCRTRSAAM